MTSLNVIYSMRIKLVNVDSKNYILNYLVKDTLLRAEITKSFYSIKDVQRYIYRSQSW